VSGKKFKKGDIVAVVDGNGRYLVTKDGSVGEVQMVEHDACFVDFYISNYGRYDIEKKSLMKLSDMKEKGCKKRS
jgi:hypothetical protein